MKKYTIGLKGTKKQNTQDITATIICDSKRQAFNIAYTFFQKGNTNIVYGTFEKGLSTIHRWLIDAENMKKYAGKYNVYRASIICNK